jgi:hypothetical protein
MPVKLLLYEQSRGIATLDALSLGIEVDDHIGGPLAINFLKANLCQTIPHAECTKAEHVRTYSLKHQSCLFSAWSLQLPLLSLD